MLTPNLSRPPGESTAGWDRVLEGDGFTVRRPLSKRLSIPPWQVRFAEGVTRLSTCHSYEGDRSEMPQALRQ